MRILIISDAWHPQVNGVVRTLTMLQQELSLLGHTADVIGPDRFRTIGMPSYRSIQLAVAPSARLVPMIEAFRPEALHIATEGPLGWAARRWALRHRVAFTTSFHTRVPEYLHARARVPLALGYAWLRRFHGPANGTMVAAGSMRRELAGRGFRNLLPWSRGVDLARFGPDEAEDWPYPRPIFLYVGRVAVEKNVDRFLSLDLPGTKVIVGDGPQRTSLQAAYPKAKFVGERHGPALAAAYAGADVFVFPSLTDTFGLVLLESLACGTPIAAHPVTGPADILSDARPGVGSLDLDLRTAALLALRGDRRACRAHAARFSWRSCAELFFENLAKPA
jgi:glycosyltransferase involved in cell wall biosynthesis